MSDDRELGDPAGKLWVDDLRDGPRAGHLENPMSTESARLDVAALRRRAEGILATVLDLPVDPEPDQVAGAAELLARLLRDLLAEMELVQSASVPPTTAHEAIGAPGWLPLGETAQSGR